MVLKYVVGAEPDILEDFIVKIYEAQNDNPGAEVYTEVLAQDVGGGHANPHVVTANGLDLVVHIVYLFGVTSGFQYHRYTAEPKIDVVTIFDPIRFKIGDGEPLTPAAGTNEYTNPILIGLDENDFVVLRREIGPMYPGIAYTFFPLEGKIQLNGGDTFFQDPDIEDNADEFTILLKPTVVQTIVNDSVVGKDFGGFVDISINTNYSNSLHLRKLLRFSGSAEFTFQLADTVPIGYPFRFQKFGILAGTSKVNFLNAPLRWTGGDKTSIDIPDYTEASFVFDGTKWNVVYISSSTFINSAAGPQAGQNIAVGTVLIGDVPAGDPNYTVTHNLNITGDYMVFLSIKSNAEATSFRNNKIGSSWWHMEDGTKKDRFRFTLQEISSETQTLSVNWLIVKV